MTPRDPDDSSALDAPLDDDLRALIARAESAPTLRPSRDLWPDIAARIDVRHGTRAPDDPAPSDTRMLVFRAREDDERAGAPTRPVARRWLAAAAVALVALSSGATYVVMRSADLRVATARAADARFRDPRPSDPRPADLPPTTVAATADSDTVTPGPRAFTSAATVSPETSRSATRARTAVRAVARSVDTGVPGAADYDREIAALRAVVLDGQGDLDSATVDVLARNLRIIDAAIAASRAALARDPRSPFLGEQLTRALGQKVDLLRTAALLPRT